MRETRSPPVSHTPTSSLLSTDPTYTSDLIKKHCMSHATRHDMSFHSCQTLRHAVLWRHGGGGGYSC